MKKTTSRVTFPWLAGWPLRTPRPDPAVNTPPRLLPASHEPRTTGVCTYHRYIDRYICTYSCHPSRQPSQNLVRLSVVGSAHPPPIHPSLLPSSFPAWTDGISAIINWYSPKGEGGVCTHRVAGRRKHTCHTFAEGALGGDATATLREHVS